MNRLIVISLFVITFAALTHHETLAEDARPNVLMICIDDLNDWVEPLGGHPQARTPAMSRLAESGMLFTNAHCQSPLCNSSRTSLMLSRRPSETGVYGLAPWFRGVPELSRLTTLPQHFAAAGYKTITAGKVFHGGAFRKKDPLGRKEFDIVGPPGRAGIKPPKKLIPPTPGGDHPLMDWGVFDHDEKDKGDYQVASFLVEQLENLDGDGPVFIAGGFFLPHVPCHVTPKYWDMFPEQTLILPHIDRLERKDCSPFAWYLHWDLPEPRLSWLDENDQLANLTRSYLGCIAFMDDQLARVLAALERSAIANNTIVCLWSDHGWHLGEKNITGKNTLWEPSTRVPLIFSGPGIPQGVCQQPAELLDIYPTLADLAGLSKPDGVQGLSLRPQIESPTTARRPAITDHNPGNQSIRDIRYRLIRYHDGSEELYDLEQDPNEINNVIADKSLSDIAERLRAHVDPDPAPLAPGSAARILEQTEEGYVWERKVIDPDNPPMDVSPHTAKDLPR